VVLFKFFLLSPLQYTVTHYRSCKRLREFEEIQISMQSCRCDSEFLDFGQEFGLWANFSIMMECKPESDVAAMYSVV
jgi:hypothetical protein